MTAVDQTPLDPTRLAFENLQQEVPRLNKRYFDPARFLFMFAEVIRLEPDRSANGREYKTQLRLSAGPPRNLLSGLDDTASEDTTSRLRRLIETPRDAEDAGVQHFYGLAGAHDDEAASLFDFLKGQIPDSLAELSRGGYEPDPDRISERRQAHNRTKKETWDRLRDRMRADEASFDSKARNDLDCFLFEYPDLVALSLPILGSPVVHCYFGVGSQAYYHASSLLSDLVTEHFRILSDAVTPFLFSRLSTLAGESIAGDVWGGEGPAARAERFLRDAGGLFVAKSVTVPDPDGGAPRHYIQSDLEPFTDGVRLTVPLPREWAQGQPAMIQLPRFRVFAPGPSGRNEWQWSTALPGTALQAQAVENLLGSLVDLVYRLGTAQASISTQREALDRQQRATDGAYHSLREALRHVDDTLLPTLQRASESLDVTTRTRLRAFVAAMAAAMTAKLPDTAREAWVKDPLRDPPQPSIIHFLTLDLDKELGASQDENAATIRASLTDEIMSQALRVRDLGDGGQDQLLAKKLVELLLWTRFTVTGQRCARSVLAWARGRGLLSCEPSQAGEDELLYVRNWEPLRDGNLLLMGKQGPAGSYFALKRLTVNGTVPRIAIPLAMGLVGAWADGNEHEAEITLGQTESVLKLHVDVSPAGHKTNEDSPSVADLILRTKRQLSSALDRGAALDVDRFRVCLVLLDSVFRVLESSRLGNSGFTLNVDVA